MAIQWDPTLAVGVEEIDRQHVELFARLDALLEEMNGRRRGDELQRLLGFLATYVVEHFGDEERVMREWNYPGLTAHAAQHEAFVRDLRNFEEMLGAEGPSTLLTVKVVARLVGWLRDHIYTSDGALGAFLRTA